MEHIAVWMDRPNLDDIPQHALRDGFSLRTYRPGDRDTWAQVGVASGLFDDVDKARADFDKEFAPYEAEFSERCFFVIDDSTGEAVATTTAWRDINFQDTGLDWGRIHWVGVAKDYRSRKLARPVLSAAMNYIAAHHERARLATHTGCSRAIGIYLDYGFVPALTTDRWAEAWRYLAQELKRPELAEFL